MLVTLPAPTPALSASCPFARFSSRRVIANQRSEGIDGALVRAIQQLVLQGLPTTSTRTSAAAFFSSARPCSTKIFPLMPSRSLRSIPALRGTLPTSKAQFTPRNASSTSAVATTPVKSGKAQSCSSMTTPPSASSAGAISSSRSSSGWSGPSMAPEAIRKIIA